VLAGDEATFAAWARALREAGPGHPVMLLDLDRLEHNLARVRARWPAGKAVRIVAKSLPSPQLIDLVLAALGSERQMVFHAPLIVAGARARPTSELMLGKPMPVRAAARVLADLAGSGLGFDAERQLVWLIDTGARLAQYAALGRKLRVCLELDVGMRRGGFADEATLGPVLDTLAGHPHLELAGFMGYDAHVGAVPWPLARPAAQLGAALATYRRLLSFARARQPVLLDRELIIDGAGSKTFRLHGAGSVLNELALGSALVKPGHFDLPALADLVPAIMIATPVLKAFADTTLPGLEWGKRWLSRVGASNFERSCFVYGGRWDGDYVWPPGTRANRLYGESYNQSMINVPRAAGLAVDDHVFVRPHESEQVMRQFGDLFVVRGDRFCGWWPVF
jgi:D-serine deaminase-like pyridoxal phosphate-dependent protein